MFGRECETCGGFLLRERQPFGTGVEVSCINCGRDYTTPRREPTAEERDGTQVYEVGGVMRTRRRQVLLPGMRGFSKDASPSRSAVAS